MRLAVRVAVLLFCSHTVVAMHSGNQLLSIPDSLGNLTQLTDLDLLCVPLSLSRRVRFNATTTFSGNRLSYLPDSFCHLTRLTALMLQCAPLCVTVCCHTLYVPRAQLQSLDVPPRLDRQSDAVDRADSGVRVAVISSHLSLYDVRVVAMVSNNKLESLPDSFGNLCFLTKVELRCVRHAAVSLAIASSSSVGVVVALSDNRLTRLPDSFGNLILLTELDVSCVSPRSVPFRTPCCLRGASCSARTS